MLQPVQKSGLKVTGEPGVVISAFSSYVLIVNIPDLSAHLFQLEKRIVVFPAGDLRPDTVSIGYLGNAFRPFT
jgi:hypothetical protein